MSSRLVVDGELREDVYGNCATLDGPPGAGAVIVTLEQWRRYRAELAGRTELGLLLGSDEAVDEIASDLGAFTLVALEFPRFRDGRAYSQARQLRERYGFAGELRATGEVLRDQLAFMLRVGFNAFELADAEAEAAVGFAERLRSVWYQPASDVRPTALELRRLRDGSG